jgi:hypothetical protein
MLREAVEAERAQLALLKGTELYASLQEQQNTMKEVWADSPYVGPFIAHIVQSDNVDIVGFKYFMASIGDLSRRGWDDDTELMLDWCAFGEIMPDSFGANDNDDSTIAGGDAEETRIARSAQEGDGSMRSGVNNFSGPTYMHINLRDEPESPDSSVRDNGMPIFVPTGYYRVPLDPPLPDSSPDNAKVLCSLEQRTLWPCVGCLILCNPADVGFGDFEVLVVAAVDRGLLWGVWGEISIHWHMFSPGVMDTDLVKQGQVSVFPVVPVEDEIIEVQFDSVFKSTPVVLVAPVLATSSPDFTQTVTTNVLSMRPDGFSVLLRRICRSRDPRDCEDANNLQVNIVWKAEVKACGGTTMDASGKIVEACFGLGECVQTNGNGEGQCVLLFLCVCFPRAWSCRCLYISCWLLFLLREGVVCVCCTVQTPLMGVL